MTKDSETIEKYLGVAESTFEEVEKDIKKQTSGLDKKKRLSQKEIIEQYRLTLSLTSGLFSTFRSIAKLIRINQSMIDNSINNSRAVFSMFRAVVLFAVFLSYREEVISILTWVVGQVYNFFLFIITTWPVLENKDKFGYFVGLLLVILAFMLGKLSEKRKTGKSKN